MIETQLKTQTAELVRERVDLEMSMALDTALAINYLLVNVRTWIAFLTSAFSFWKIKSSSSIHQDSPSPPDHHHHHHHQDSPSPPPPPDHHQRSPPPPRQTSAEVFMSGSWLETRRSGKFRVVYHGEDDKQEAAMKGERSRRRNIDIVVFEEGWEGLLKLKTADMGWYRHQDLTLLDGNVVQLWHAPNHLNLQHYSN